MQPVHLLPRRQGGGIHEQSHTAPRRTASRGGQVQNDTRSSPPRLLPGPSDGRLWVISSRRVSVDVVPSHGASTRLAFSTHNAHAVVAAVAAQQCLQDAVDEHNATRVVAAESAACGRAGSSQGCLANLFPPLPLWTVRTASVLRRDSVILGVAQDRKESVWLTNPL